MATTSPEGWKGTYYVNYNNGGWSESFDFAPSPVAELVQKLKDLAQYRARLLPVEATIVYARIGKKGFQRYTRRALPGPVAGSYQSGSPLVDKPMNDRQTSLLFAIEGENFSQQERFISGLPDEIITDEVWSSQAPPPALLVASPGTFQASDPPIAPATWLEGLQEFFTLVKNTTVITRPITVDDGGGLSHVEKLHNEVTGFFFRGVRFKDRGRPFGMFRGRAMSR